MPPEGYHVDPSKYPWVAPITKLLFNPAAQPMPNFLQDELARWSRSAQRPLTQPEIDAVVYYQVKATNNNEIWPELASCAAFYHERRTAAENRLPFRADVLLRRAGFLWPAGERGLVKSSKHIQLGGMGIFLRRYAAYTILYAFCADQICMKVAEKMMRDGFQHDERLRDLSWSSRFSKK